jgi:hypothetical protein
MSVLRPIGRDTLVILLVCFANVGQIQAQFAVGGIYIDAEGMLKHTSTLAADERLGLQRAEAFAPPGSVSLAAVSPLRKVSLRRLEEQVSRLIDDDKPLPADVRYLAGLNRITHVLFFPETGDVVIAGPAEGWKQSASGGVLGVKSNRPPLELDDLIVALRYAMSKQPTAPFIGCSIDPTAGGMKNYAAYMRQLGGIDRSRITQVFGGMERAMGPQSVRLFGVPASSRFALKLLAADYRLKRIALAHDPPPVKGVTNYLDLAAKRLRPGPQRQHRWWFVGEYDAVFHTANNLAFELDGQGVRVATAPTATSNTSGKKTKGPIAAPAARQFATSMTRYVDDTAARLPVFAELQNLVGLSVVAELIAERRRDDEGSWSPNEFLNKAAYKVATARVPKSVPSLANYRLVKNRHWLISVSGGVEINPRTIIGRTARKEAPTKRRLAETRNANRVPKDAERWWWD